MGMVPMIIFGAGLAGLLAARRLWSYNPIIYEKQREIPNNHSALLRFRTNDVGEALSLPFKKVNVYKGVLCEDGVTITNNPTIRDFNAYSIKSIGHVIERSIIDTKNAVRFIAPGNLIESLSNKATIKCECDCRNYIGTGEYDPIISTIPMPELMRILDYPSKFTVKFDTRPIWTINCELRNVEVYQTLYVPYNKDEPYRVSITGNKMTLEFAFEPPGNSDLWFIDHYLDIILGANDIKLKSGYIETKMQQYGKILSIDDIERKKFILWATDKFNIYSLGRYATWRQILLDDVLKDISIINTFIQQRSGYERTLTAMEKVI
jgi:hypothetical protein